jgi:ketosteroid isomerase-like protein
MKRKLPLLAVGALLLFTGPGSFAGANDDTELLKVRRSVWIKWIENDQEALKKLVPADTVVISTGEPGIKHQEEVLQGAAAFHSAGGKLLNLEFPKTEVQHFGDVAVTWSEYVLELEIGGKREKTVGRVVEVFVKRNGEWTNPGWHTDAESFLPKAAGS